MAANTERPKGVDRALRRNYLERLAHAKKRYETEVAVKHPDIIKRLLNIDTSIRARVRKNSE